MKNYENWIGDITDLENEATLLCKKIALQDKEANTRLIRDYVRRGIVSKPVRKPQLDPKRSYYEFEHIVELMFALVMRGREKWGLDQIAGFKTSEPIESLIGLLPDELFGKSSGKKTAARSLISKFQSQTQAEGDISPRAAALRYRQKRMSQQKTSQQAMSKLGLSAGDVQTKNFTRLVLSDWCHIYFDAEVIKHLPDEDIETWGSAAAQMVIENIKKKQF